MLARGLVVAYPTDTVYGLAVDPRNPEAVRRLFALKARDASSALTLIAADLEQARLAAELGETAEQLARAFWPGPLTIVGLARAGLTAEAVAGGDTVGVRVPDHAVAVALAREAGFPVTATSANVSGQPASSSAAVVLAALPALTPSSTQVHRREGCRPRSSGACDGHVELVRAGAVSWERVLTLESLFEDRALEEALE